MKNILTICIGLLFTLGLSAQSVGDYKIVDKGSSNKRMKKKPKRVLISDFQVTYQVGFTQTDEKQGGRMFGGGVKGDSKASLTLAIPGISEQELQQITNELYAEYVAELKSQGFEIVSIDELWNHKAYVKKREDRWEKVSSTGPLPGFYFGNVRTRPEGVTFITTKGTTDGSPLSAKQVSYTYGTNMKVEADADFIMNNVVIAVTSFDDNKGAASKMLGRMSKTAKVKAKANFKINGTYSYNNFNYYSKFSVEELPINGVLKEQKFEAMQVADRDSWGTDMGMFKVYRADNWEISQATIVNCDPQKYKAGAKLGGSAFLKGTLQKMYEVVK